MSRLRYVADTSVFARLTNPSVSSSFSPRAAAGQVAMCAPVAFELGYSARNRDDYDAIATRLWSFPPVDVTAADHRRALEVQAAMAERGKHRALSLVDALVAATAEANDLAVLHYDSDFELVAAVTGQAQEWVVPRGSVS